jgi:rSAM/selenodomain-associated transferase 1
VSVAPAVARRRAIAIFAKEPRPGAVKTRLVPALTAHDAARLAESMLLDTIATARRVARAVDADVVVFFSPAHARASFRKRVGAGVRLHDQTDGDLSDRLIAAYRRLYAGGTTAVCFIGADSPTLPPEFLESAFAALREDDDVVVGPATDGGYYAIALAAPHVGVFAGIAWSTSRVFEQTCAAAVRLGLRLSLLPAWYDVDDLPSLRRLGDELRVVDEHDETIAPLTRRFLAATRM